MAIVTRLAGTKVKVMPEYRAYMVGAEGNFVGYEPLICADDGEAIGKAKRLAGQYPVELWSGPRLVSSIPKQRARAVTHEIHEGCMVPKAT
jgi:hypothetical protein